jgi:FAD/FMN-containing dehydrogenase
MAMSQKFARTEFPDLASVLGDRLLDVKSTLEAGLLAREGEDSPGLANPFFIEDEPGGFHTTGWFGAYDSAPSRYAIAAESAEDIATTIAFARRRQIPLVVKGTGHDYLGRSNAPDALLVWTHRMREIVIHESFVPRGLGIESSMGAPAVSLGAGTRWLEAYQALAKHGRYVQGGGCTTVGAAGGFTQGGGFGHFSRRYGTAAGNVLEMEVVTASGEVLAVNENLRPDLFWALRGGGGGTFGVVSNVTMRTYEMPSLIGRVTGSVTAKNDDAFRSLLSELVVLLPILCDSNWGEYISVNPDNSVVFALLAVDLPERDMQARLDRLLSRVGRQPEMFTSNVRVTATDFATHWDAASWDHVRPRAIRRDRRRSAPRAHFWWAGNQEEVSCYINALDSWWLPGRLLEHSPRAVTNALFEASRHWPVRLDLNKALWGTSAEVQGRDRATAINPGVFDAAALVLVFSGQRFAFPGVAGHEPDMAVAATSARKASQAISIMTALAPEAGSYSNETSYFKPDWQRAFWGENYPRLLEIKRRYDPDNVVRVHHGVGSEFGANYAAAE